MNRRQIGVYCVVIGTTLALGGCKEGGLGGTMSTQQEKDAGAQYASELDKHLKYVDDSKLNSRILEVALPIFAEASKERPDVTFRIRIIDDKDVNAFSIPGGYLYINKGLIDKLGKDDDAIACVIGHESAHVVRRHVVKQIADAQNKGLLVDVAAVLTKSSVIGNVGSTLVDLQQMHFSRNDEYEADRWGERFAYAAGFDPAGMLRTFKVLEDVEKKSGDHDPAYFKDHPVTRNRALRALEQWRELRANNGQYISPQYQADGDQVAAKKNGISYPALVLATPADVSNLPPDKGDAPAANDKSTPAGDSKKSDPADTSSKTTPSGDAGAPASQSDASGKKH